MIAVPDSSKFPHTHISFMRKNTFFSKFKQKNIPQKYSSDSCSSGIDDYELSNFSVSSYQKQPRLNHYQASRLARSHAIVNRNFVRLVLYNKPACQNGTCPSLIQF